MMVIAVIDLYDFNRKVSPFSALHAVLVVCETVSCHSVIKNTVSAIMLLISISYEIFMYLLVLPIVPDKAKLIINFIKEQNTNWISSYDVF